MKNLLFILLIFNSFIICSDKEDKEYYETEKKAKENYNLDEKRNDEEAHQNHILGSTRRYNDRTIGDVLAFQNHRIQAQTNQVTYAFRLLRALFRK